MAEHSDETFAAAYPHTYALGVTDDMIGRAYDAAIGSDGEPGVVYFTWDGYGMGAARRVTRRLIETLAQSIVEKGARG